MSGAIPGLRIERLTVPLRGTDRDAILALQHEAFTNRWSPETVDGLLTSPAGRVYVARRADGDTAAFAACYVIADEVHINTIAVAPGSRRQGVASALITAILSEAGSSRATLEVRRSNSAALALYAALGFQVTAVRPGYYENPDEDGLILWLNP